MAGPEGQETVDENVETEIKSEASEQSTTEKLEPSQEGKSGTEEETLLAGLNESEIKRLLANASRVDELEARLQATQDELVDTRTRLHGRFGEVNRDMKKLQEREPAGIPRKLSPDKFKRIKEHWGDEATQALADDLSELVAEDTQDDQDQVAEQIKKLDVYYQGRLRSLSEDMRKRDKQELTRLRPTWEKDKDTSEFALFKSQLPVEDRVTFDSSWDAHEVNDIYQKFDKWKEKSTRQTQKDKRLEGAIQPRGQSTADHQMSDHAAFAEGVKSVLGNRYKKL